MKKRAATERARQRDGTSDFGARAKAWREYVGLSVLEVADRVGVTSEAVYMLEGGRTRRPSAEHEPLFFKAFDVTPAQFWGPIPTKPKAA